MQGFINEQSEIVGDVQIGEGTRINGPAYLRGHETAPLRIGRYCAIGYNLCIQTRTHDLNHANVNVALQRENGFQSVSGTRGGVTLGHNCHIGDNVCVLSGVTVGSGAVIGAGSVVTRDVPPFGVAYGVPAKVHRIRFSESMVEQLLDIAWWDWDDRTIAANQAFFNLDLTRCGDIDLKSLIVK